MHKVEQTFPKELEYAEKLVSIMDDKFKIPFVNFRFGLDPIIGLIPFGGDVITFLISSYCSCAFPKRSSSFRNSYNGG